MYSYCAVSWVCQLYILMKCISFLLFSLSPLRVFCARPTGLGCDMLCALYMDDSKCVATLKLESAVNCLATIAVAIATRMFMSIIMNYPYVSVCVAVFVIC